MNIDDNKKKFLLATLNSSLPEKVQKASNQLSIVSSLTSQLMKQDDKAAWFKLLLRMNGDDAIKLLSAQAEISLELLKSLKPVWDFNYLSCNQSLPWSLEIIERFAIQWDWEWLLNNPSISDLVFDGLGRSFILQKSAEFSALDEQRTDFSDESNAILLGISTPCSIKQYQINNENLNWHELIVSKRLPALVFDESDIEELITKITKKGAAQGNPNFQYILGWMHYYGKGGISKNEMLSALFYEQAATQGHSLAQFQVASMYDDSDGVQQDSSRATEFYEMAVEQGHVKAMCNLGLKYKEYGGVEQDYVRAVEFYEMAESYWQTDVRNINCAMVEGIARSMLHLADMFEESRGVIKDDNRIRNLRERALQLLEQESTQWEADSKCIILLAGMYVVDKGVKPDYARAVELFQLAVDQDDADAQLILGNMFKTGMGVEKDYARAVELFQLAVDQGEASAQCNLAIMYKTGGGVEQNYARAIELFQLAADQGLATAQCILANMYEEGIGVEQDYARAVELYQLGVDQDDANAQLGLAVMYFEGKGVEQDNARAEELWGLYQLDIKQGEL
jgi:TPR repeat protein